MSNTINKNLGVVTAYGYAVEGGYQGTEAQFMELLANARGIVSIVLTATDGLVKTYTILYTDGTTTTFNVTDGEDGEVTETQLNNAIEEAKGTKADAIVRSASGDIASYDDGGDLPMKSLKVNIVPKQSGTGDPSPSNVRPISGAGEVGIVVDGKNILSDEVQHLGLDGATGELLSNNARYALVVPYPKAGTKYTISRSAVGSSSYYYYGFYTELTAGQLPIGYHNMDTTTSYTVTAPEGAKYLVIFYGAALSPNPQVEVGETATDYVPYNPNSETKSITLPQTVYGGTLDVVKGKLVIDKYYWTNDGSRAMGVGSNVYNGNLGTDRYISIPQAIKHFNTDHPLGSIGMISDHFKGGLGAVQLWNSPDNYVNQFTVNQATELHTVFENSAVGITSDMDSATRTTKIRDWLAQNPVSYVFPLATPIEIQLTPTEVKSLLGDNNVWSDSGSVEVEYRADTSLVINKILEALEG